MGARIPNINCLWGEIVAGTLARLGLKYAVIAPGSRSAPLVWGLTRNKEIQAISVLDERSAGFYALGLAKASGLPVALVCTSGTAAANFYPAVIEASQSAVPLLVLTADRPPELRDCHAGQAIDQVKLYGHFPRWQHEVAIPENTPTLLRYLRQTLIHAWERAQYPWAGPVHLNFPFREPLAPVEVKGFKAPSSAFLKKLMNAEEEPASGEIRSGFNHGSSAGKVLNARKGVIVAGPAQPGRRDVYGNELIRWALKRGWPVLADALSPLRQMSGLGTQLVAQYDLILRAEKGLKRLTPEAVIQLGAPPTSKKLLSWLETLEVPVLVMHDGPENVDPLHRGATVWRAQETLLPELDKNPPKAQAGYASRWKKLQNSAAQAVGKELTELGWLFEGKAARILSQKLPKETPVFVASSMPVRDWEYFGEPGGGQNLFFNRGANGIDGTLSTALGVAHATGRPTVLHTGDLALLHDQNGLLAARELPKGASLTIVLMNNNGGGIFEHLPMAKFDPPYEKFFATPQHVDFEKFSAMYNLEYFCPKTWHEFEGNLLPLPASGVRLIEVRTDRKRDAAFRRKLFNDIAGQLENPR